MPRKTRKRNKRNNYLKCKMKSCRAKKYKSIYGGASFGSIRSPSSLY